MSLASFFPEQFDELERFMTHPTERVRQVLIDPEMRVLFRKALVAIDDDPGFGHVLIPYDAAFLEPVSWFGGLLDALCAAMTTHTDALVDAGVPIAPPAPDSTPMQSPGRFLTFAQTVAARLPDHVGSLVFLLEPERIEDTSAWRRSLAFLADETGSEWLKFVVLDDRQAPLLNELAQEHPRVGSQCFWLSPEEMERRADQDIAAAGADRGAEGRLAMGLAAGFAFGRRDYPKAEQLQRAIVSGAERDGTPLETANGLYNLGNTLLAKGEFDEAATTLTRACELCTEHRLDQLAPMAFSNLGISLYRLGEIEHGLNSLKVARDHFKALENRPGEAYVCDCLAGMHLEQGRRDEAEKAWRYALQLYESITNPAMAEIRDAGRRDITDKLARIEGS